MNSGKRFLLPSTAVFAMLWAIARACVQSVTIDEADSYLTWVARSAPNQWEASSNNHVLNSLLERLFTSIFGLSHLSLRAPALIGAALYIAGVYFLCVLLTEEVMLQWPLFVCLVYNPFVFDYLVAARGYSLAMGFLIWAIAILMCEKREPKVCAACSICLALSFAANFSFAFADGATLIVLLFRSIRRREDYLRTLAACTLPGLGVTIFLSASAGPAIP